MKTLHQFAVATVLSAFAAGTTAIAAQPDTSTLSANANTPIVEKKRKCKKGYRYSHSRMRCVKKRYRGSH